MQRLLVKILVLAVAVGLTAGLLPGVHVDGGFGALLLIAIVWGLINGILGPIARLLSLPLTLVTFGLFALVVNGLLFLLTDAVVGALHVDGLGWAILAAAVVGIFTAVLTWTTDRVTGSYRLAH